MYTSRFKKDKISSYSKIPPRFKILFDFESKWLKENIPEFVYSGELLRVLHFNSVWDFNLKKFVNQIKLAEAYGIHAAESENENSITFSMISDFNLTILLKDARKIMSTNNEFYEYLRIEGGNTKSYYMILDKKDITLKSTIHRIERDQEYLKYWSKVDLNIDWESTSMTILEMLDLIPKHIECRLEFDDDERIIELMKHHDFIEKLNERGTKFLCKGIEIKPKEINSEQEEKEIDKEIFRIQMRKRKPELKCK